MRPEDVLPDDVNSVDLGGLRVRKGSIGAFIANARAIASAATSEEERRKAETDLRALVPGLRKLGLFEVFEIREEIVRRMVESVPLDSSQK